MTNDHSADQRPAPPGVDDHQRGARATDRLDLGPGVDVRRDEVGAPGGAGPRPAPPGTSRCASAPTRPSPSA
jgi:hypothetical protein